MFRTKLRVPALATLFAGLFTGFALVASSARAQDAQSQTACLVYADLAVSARAMASLKVPEQTTRAWAGMVYRFGDGAARTMADKVLNAAYQSNDEPQAFAKLVAAACLTGGADGNGTDALEGGSV